MYSIYDSNLYSKILLFVVIKDIESNGTNKNNKTLYEGVNGVYSIDIDVKNKSKIEKNKQKNKE